MSFPRSMKPFRLLAIVAGAMVLLLIGAVALAFNSAFQTWVARKAIASKPEVRASIGSVAAGMQRVTLKDLHFEQSGAVLTLPAIEIDVPLVSAGWNKKVLVTRLVAKGWTLDLTKVAEAKNQAKPATPPSSPVTNAVQAFAGVFTQLQLPTDVSLDGVDLEGDVVLPENRGKTKVTLKGGGLRAGSEGKFDLTANAALNDRDVNAVEMRAQLGAVMDTPRTFTKIALKANAAAKGEKFPNGVKLTADLSTTRADTGETYSIAVATADQEIVRVKADFPKSAERLAGTWKLDVRDADVAPFALGIPLPRFDVAGQGTFETDPVFTAFHATGRLNTVTDRLRVVRVELAQVGELKLAADFDVLARSGTLAVQKLEASLTAERPVASVRALQPFEFNPQTAELKVADGARDAFGIALQGLPIAWAKPFLKDFTVTGGHLRGEFVAAQRGAGVVLRSTAPVTLDGIAVEQGGKPLARGLDLTMNVSGDYAPQGWQAEISGLTVKSGDARVLTADIKAGQLAGGQQPIKAAGKIFANLPALLTQPAAAGLLTLTSGDALVEFAASLSAKQEVQAKLALRELATESEKQPVKLPTLTADLRVEVAPDGKITLWTPIVIEHNERKSDLTITGSLVAGKDKLRTIEANVTSAQLVVDDAKIFAAVLPVAEKKKAEPMNPGTAPASAPPWAGFAGSIGLQLKRVLYSETFEVTELAGRVKIDEGTLKLEGLQAGLGETGRAKLDGAVTFNAAAPQPYALMAEMNLKEFDPGPLLRAFNGNQPPVVEGRFDVASKLASHASSMGDLAAGADGDFQLTSKGGIFRGLPVSVGNAAESPGKIAGWIAALGSLASKKGSDDIGSRPQAIAEVAKGIYPIPYDQLSMVLSRDAALNTTLREFILIAPEVRLTGGGTALHKPGSSLFEDSLAMEFRLRSRGRLETALKYLGAVEARPDDLGYTTCLIPLRIGGTIAKPDATESSKILAALLVEKSGVSEKAGELIDKLFGRTKG